MVGGFIRASKTTLMPDSRTFCSNFCASLTCKTPKRQSKHKPEYPRPALNQIPLSQDYIRKQREASSGPLSKEGYKQPCAMLSY